MSVITPLKKEHAGELFPMVYRSSVVNTIQWDGPSSFEEFEQGLELREQQMIEGAVHIWAIVDPESGKLAGTADIRPDANGFRGNIGLWVGEPFQGKGLGTLAVAAITEYGFSKLGLNKIEGYIFVGNVASRRIFEKCGYEMEGTIRSAVQKFGKPVDEWVLGIVKTPTSISCN